MSPSIKLLPPLAIAVGMVWLAWYFLPRAPVNPPGSDGAAGPKPTVAQPISLLGETPDWSLLESRGGTITRTEFESLLTSVFTTGNAWREFIEIDDTEARIRTTKDPESPVRRLRFATGENPKSPPRYWKAASQLRPSAAGSPLAGLRIAIDPGHLGGEWAKMEGRWLKVGDQAPVCEGDMTLYVAKLLNTRLTALGARVFLVRKGNEPVTRLRPDTLMEEARRSLPEGSPEEDVRKAAEQLFYRTAEIRARARIVNEIIKPDLVLCLHFNAEPWGDPAQPTLVDRTHFHLLLNGAFTNAELEMEDQRAAMLGKLLSRTHDEEVRVASTVAEVFTAASGLPAFSYPPNSPNARAIPGQPCLWARNLLANRLYQCPVIFMEPYVMNSTIDHARIQAGDYPGPREVAGKLRRSIFKEYADGVTEALAIHYRKARTPAK